jgi:hypothetical protein
MRTAKKSPSGNQRRAEEPCLISADPLDGIVTYQYSTSERPPRFEVEHDRKRRLIRILDSKGPTRVFRDRPVQYLVVTRDPDTGESTPVFRFAEPEYLCLCPEQLERR